jgi:hypothetical protein
MLNKPLARSKRTSTPPIMAEFMRSRFGMDDMCGTVIKLCSDLDISDPVGIVIVLIGSMVLDL